ncbi:WYL domain-containing protein [Nocardia cyriacigeorgica]|uniref:WYL domain-containing protein n=1 Tax=Nocardia cyriacigeorgica TaxID=135487 RepID=A0A6P1D3K8_9NOCA|nr:WYL domain-containing protein [Nocardia cyriacigeorgica]NEW41620.1 WYL domain-containing protein [Nocardia cyriacigeorgica]NEW44109.1 WYL domain-containing protein [Nocardia cyriacigeorgica]NEW52306.1 WYL domain-containing protein [Nocardia cyriacigeorgica]NEW56292.1 WYL domain-containing protein [Nocardia cyriacigeorgica]
MLDTSARLLKLLALLQTHRDWTGSELAERLQVTSRTVRRDVDRLRELGYPVHATKGAGGYRLGAGAALPPLLLDDEEAVAVAVGLRSAADGTVAGIEEASLRALTKLEQVLPPRLRHRVRTLRAATVRIGAPATTVAPDTLMVIAEACRRHEQLRFDYRAHDGTTSIRRTEPHSLVNTARRWYLVAWDIDRVDWRTFRVDRLTPRTPTGPRFAPREPPDGDVAAYVSMGLSSRTWSHRATVLLHASAAVASARVWPGMGVVEDVDGRTCHLHVGADTPEDLVWMITAIDLDFTLVDGPEALVAALRAQAARCLGAVRDR